jgi:hypothetical protein
MFRKLLFTLALGAVLLATTPAPAGPPPSKVVVKVGFGGPFYHFPKYPYPVYPAPVVYPSVVYPDVPSAYTVMYRASSYEPWHVYATFPSLSLANNASESLQGNGYYTRVTY